MVYSILYRLFLFLGDIKMPYPNEHAARIIDPNDFEKDSFRRENPTDGISIIIGKLKGQDTMTAQAYRFDKKEYTTSEAKNWLKEHNIDYISFEPAKEEMAELETVNMTKEILSVGKFNGIDITEQDINDMIENFSELKDTKEVSMRIGHTSDDKPNTKILRAGTVDSLVKGISKKTGKTTLIAKLRNTPKQIAEFIEKELLKPVSIEFLRKWKDGITGKEYKNVLTAIALMGSAQPAVPGLADFEISFSENADEYIKIEYQEENSMNEVELKELQEKNAVIATELAAKEAERLKVVEQKEALEKELAEFKEKIANKEIVEFVEQNPTKILPFEKDRVLRIFKALDNETISFEEGETKLTARQEFQTFISGLKDRVEFGVSTENPKIEKTVEFKSEDEKRDFIAKEAVKISKEKNITLSQAQDELVSQYK
jgi:hypothetical protein